MNWRGHDGSLGRLTARRLPVQDWQPLPVLWNDGVPWRGRLRVPLRERSRLLPGTLRVDASARSLRELGSLLNTGEVEGKPYGFDGLQNRSGAGEADWTDRPIRLLAVAWPRLARSGRWTSLGRAGITQRRKCSDSVPGQGSISECSRDKRRKEGVGKSD